MNGPPLDLHTIAARLRAQAPPGSRARERGCGGRDPLFRAGQDSAEVLFIERAKRDGDPWSGHIAVPRRQAQPKGDPSLLATAMRETQEEVGLRLPGAALLTRLPDFYTRSNAYRVAQLTFALDDDGGVLTPSPEVAAVLWTPLSHLVALEHAGTMTFEHEGTPMALPCVHLGSHVLWGMTYRMMRGLLDVLGA